MKGIRSLTSEVIIIRQSAELCSHHATLVFWSIKIDEKKKKKKLFRKTHSAEKARNELREKKSSMIVMSLFLLELW